MRVPTYRTTVTRDPESATWLLVDVEGVGVTRARTVSGAQVAARELIAVTRDVPGVDIDVELADARTH